MKKLLAFALLVLTLAALLPSPAQAASARPVAADKSRITVGVRTSGPQNADNRGRYEYEIAPRGVREDFIALYNYAYTPVTVQLIARDGSTTTDGDFTSQPTTDKPLDVGAWITPERNVVRLAARSMTVVPFQISVPYNATPGDHAGALIVSLLAREPGQNSKSIVVEHRVGLRVYLRVPGALKAQLSIEHLTSTFTGSWTPLGIGRTDVSYAVRNTGNVRLSATQAVELSRALGLSSASTSPAEITDLLPGSTVLVHTSFGSRWAIGSLGTKVTLKPSGVDSSLGVLPAVVASTSTFVLPWLLILIVLLLLALGGGYWRWRRIRRRRSAEDAGPDHATATAEEPVLVSRGSTTVVHKHAGPKSRSRRRIARRSGAAVLGLLAVVAIGSGLVGTPERADAKGGTPIWRASVTPKSGADDEPFSVRTSGACPAPARNIVGRVYGAGFPATGVNVIGNSSAGVSPDGGFEVPLFETLRDTMVRQKVYVPLHGIYRLVVRCIIPAYVDRSYGDYVAEINFVNPSHWIAMAPVTNVIGPHANPDGSMTGPSSPGHPGKVTPKKTGAGTGPSAGQPTASPSSPNAAGPTSQTASGTSNSGSSWVPTAVFIGGGALIAGATVLMLRKGRNT